MFGLSERSYEMTSFVCISGIGEGILVPASAELVVRGDGDLQISNTRNYAVGIGSSYNDPCHFGVFLLYCFSDRRVRNAARSI